MVAGTYLIEIDGEARGEAKLKAIHDLRHHPGLFIIAKDRKYTYTEFSELELIKPKIKALGGALSKNIRLLPYRPGTPHRIGNQVEEQGAAGGYEQPLTLLPQNSTQNNPKEILLRPSFHSSQDPNNQRPNSIPENPPPLRPSPPIPTPTTSNHQSNSNNSASFDMSLQQAAQNFPGTTNRPSLQQELEALNLRGNGRTDRDEGGHEPTPSSNRVEQIRQGMVDRIINEEQNLIEGQAQNHNGEQSNRLQQNQNTSGNVQRNANNLMEMESPRNSFRLLEHENMRREERNVAHISTIQNLNRQVNSTQIQMQDDFNDYIEISDEEMQADNERRRRQNCFRTKKFTEVLKLINPYDKEQPHMFISECDLAFRHVRPQDYDILLDSITITANRAIADVASGRYIKTWEELKALILRKQMGRKDLTKLMEEFNSLQQGENEDIDDYFTRAIKYRRKIEFFESAPGNWKGVIPKAHEKLIQSTCWGLQSYGLQTLLFNTPPESLEDARDRAEKWEMQYPKRNLRTNFGNPVRTVTHGHYQNNYNTQDHGIERKRNPQWQTQQDNHEDYKEQSRSQQYAVYPNKNRAQHVERNYNGQGYPNTQYRSYTSRGNTSQNWRAPEPNANQQNNNYRQGTHRNEQANYNRDNSRRNGDQNIRAINIENVLTVNCDDASYVMVEMNGKILRALIDTGAAVCLLAQKFVDENSMDTKDKPTLRGICGNVSALGVKRESMIMGDISFNAEFVVVEDKVTEPFDAFIGLRTLAKNGWNIDYENDRIWKGMKWAKLYKTCEIPEGTQNENDEQRGDDRASQREESQQSNYNKSNYNETMNNTNDEDFDEQGLHDLNKFEGEIIMMNDERKDSFESEDEEENGNIEELIEQIQQEFAEVFGELPETPSDRLIPLAIRLKPDAELQRSKHYRLAPHLEEVVRKEVSSLEQKGVIKKGTTPFVSPLWVVGKKSETPGVPNFRMVMDYRKLNEITIFENYPLPRIDEILDKLGKVRFFSKMDLQSGFYQIPVVQDDQYKTGFTALGETYVFTRSPFGSVNSGQNFQRNMNRVLEGLIGKICHVYIDDIIIYGSTVSEHYENIRTVLSRLNEYKLRVKLSKCEFFAKEIEFLGHRITSNGIGMNVEKIDALKTMSAPKNARKLRSFLGMVNFYRRFVPNYSIVAQPLFKLLKKNTKYVWDEEKEKAFNDLLAAIVRNAILAYPDFSKQFHLTTDACNYGIGAVLHQEDKDGIQRPIAFISTKLKTAEINYSTIEKECLAIVWAIKSLRHYLIGREFIVHCDNKPLQWLHKNVNSASRLFRWYAGLSEYKYSIQFKPGKDNVVADELSRNFPEHVDDDDISGEKENEMKRAVEENSICNIRHLFMVRTRSSPPEIVPDANEVFGSLNLKTKKDDDVHDKIDEKNVQWEDDEEEDEKYREKCDREPTRDVKRITDPGRIEEIIKEMHEAIWWGHRGINATEHAIKLYFAIPKLRELVTEYISKCDACQRSKHSRFNRNLPMALTSTCHSANEKIGIDLIGPFIYKNRNKRYALTIQDDFSKYITFCGVEDCTANSVAKALIEEWILVFGIPREILSDNGGNLVGHLMKEIARYFGVKQIRTSIGHPRANGSVEKAHLRVAEFMRATESEMEAYPEWTMKLKLAAYAHNTTVHASTGCTPYQLMFGVAPRLISSVFNDNPFITPQSYVAKLQQQQKELWATARERIIQSKERSRLRDETTKPKRRIEEFKKGMKILVRTEVLKGKVNRTEDPWTGPFVITDVHEHCLNVKGRRSTINMGDCKPYIETIDS